MSKEKLFTQEELNEMGRKTVDVLQETIDAGDKDKAKKLSRRMYSEFLGMHDLYRDWVTALLSFIAKRYGDDVLLEALNESYGGITKRLGKHYSGKTLKQKIQILTAGLRGHLQPFKVEEDDEKVAIITTPCASGGRLVLDGYYDAPVNFTKIKKKQPMTFDRADFPVYCAHCYIQNITPYEPGEEPLFLTHPAEKLGEQPCKGFIRK